MPWSGSRFSSGSALGRPIMGVRGEMLQRVKRPILRARVCSQSFQPAVPTRTASQRMRSWYDELGSGRGRLLGPPELGPVGPDASQDHGDLAGYGDTRLLRSNAPRQPRSPCLEGRPALHFREKDAGSLIKAGTGKSVSAFRYPALGVRKRILHRRDLCSATKSRFVNHLNALFNRVR